MSKGQFGQRRPEDLSVRDQVGLLNLDGSIVVSDPAFLFSADFARVGDDLILTGQDGAVVVLRDHFSDGELAPIWATNGARLSPQMVESLVGPRAPGQYAQAGETAGVDPIGTVTIVEGTATATRADGVAVVLTPGDPVFQGDLLETGTGAKLSLEFADGTLFSLSKSARVVLDSSSTIRPVAPAPWVCR